MANYDVESHTHTWYRIMFRFLFWAPYMLVRPVMKRLFFPWKTKQKKARFARAPHYYIFVCGGSAFAANNGSKQQQSQPNIFAAALAIVVVALGHSLYFLSFPAAAYNLLGQPLLYVVLLLPISKRIHLLHLLESPRSRSCQRGCLHQSFCPHLTENSRNP